MSRLVESEELELEPLLLSAPEAQDPDGMANTEYRDDDQDFKDAEKATVEGRPVSVVESLPEPSPEERRLVRKLDKRILPVACILYLFACECQDCILYAYNADRHAQILIGRIWGMPGYKACHKMRLAAIPLVTSLTGSTRHSSFHMYVSLRECMYAWFAILTKRQILCQIPATVASKLFPPRLWLGGAAICWGLSSTLMVSIDMLPLASYSQSVLAVHRV